MPVVSRKCVHNDEMQQSRLDSLISRGDTQSHCLSPWTFRSYHAKRALKGEIIVILKEAWVCGLGHYSWSVMCESRHLESGSESRNLESESSWIQIHPAQKALNPDSNPNQDSVSHSTAPDADVTCGHFHWKIKHCTIYYIGLDGPFSVMRPICDCKQK